MGKFKDITGEKYNKLVAVEYMGSHKWRFKCDCGGEIVAYSDNVMRGYTKSCGCLKRLSRKEKEFPHEDITGQKFNKLTATKYLGDGRWLCICECGNTSRVSKFSLKTGRTKSCGCQRHPIGELSIKWKNGNVSYRSYHRRVESARGKAKFAGCYICGRKDDGISYDWANLTGHYEDINDYAPMCRSCHRQYDKKKREGG